MRISLLLAPLILAGCYVAEDSSPGGNYSQSSGVNISQSPMPVSADMEEPEIEEPNEPEVNTDDRYFYFSYDDASSTAARDLTFAYLQNNQLPPAQFARPYEFLNGEEFLPFNEISMEPFNVSLGLMKVDPQDIPIIAEANDIYALGINVRGPEITLEERDNIVLTILLDISGSMSSRYSPYVTDQNVQSLLDVAKHGLHALPSSLKSGDIINLVTFEGSTDVVLNAYDVDDGMTEYLRVVDSINTAGSTNIQLGVQRAYEVAGQNFDQEKDNLIIIMTDAHVTSGEFDPQYVAQQTMRNELEGIYFGGIGIGAQFNDQYLNEVTEAGKSAYSAMITPEDANRILGRDLTRFLAPAVKNVRFKLTHPHDLTRVVGAAEEVSQNKEDIQPINFSYNSSQFFLETFSGEEGFDTSQNMTFSFEYEDENGVMIVREEMQSIDALMLNADAQIIDAGLILALSELMKDNIQCEEVLNSELLTQPITTDMYFKYSKAINDYCDLDINPVEENLDNGF